MFDVTVVFTAFSVRVAASGIIIIIIIIIIQTDSSPDKYSSTWNARVN